MSHDTSASGITAAAGSSTPVPASFSSAVVTSSSTAPSSNLQLQPFSSSSLDFSSPSVRRFGSIHDPPVLPSLDSHRMFGMPTPFTWNPTPIVPTLPPITAPIGPPPVLLGSYSSQSLPLLSTTQPGPSSSSLPTFTGVTFSGQPGTSPLTPHQSALTPGFSLASSFLGSLASQLTFSTPNVTNIVTTRLKAVEDYLPWRTQFESFLVSHSLLGILDGSVLAPPQVLTDEHHREVPNPEYHYWLKIDQTVRSWLFATLSRDILMEVYDLKFSARIWESLETCFMSACLARSIELKRQLSHIKKKESQTIDQYLLEVKLLADNLNSINSPVSNRDVIEYTINGLGPDYESLISIISYIPGNATIESLRPVLLAQEQRNQFLRSQDMAPAHQAFAAAPAAPAVPAGQNRGGAAPAARGQGGRAPAGRGYRGGRGRGQRGRGRGYGVQFQHQQAVYGNQQAPLLPLPPFGQYGPPRVQAPAGNPGSVLCNIKSGYSYLNHFYTCC
ncbi:unnamed protein product [Cuscuta epithymum]|uniref:Uncharacterized protein n=1 Tax=Cuscuta epithymum TaxID=186058 RepID=A0AAV0CE00_9ASTE|nr:unnamed protein product [Cuscuta epithymum]